jgi:hypothetical protein
MQPRSMALLVAVVAIAACTSEDTPSVIPTEDGGGQTAATDAAPATHGPEGVMELAGIQQTHSSGTTVAVTAVEVDDAGDLYVSFEALVAGRRSAALVSDGALAEDDLGGRYEFVPPEGNPTIDLAQDSRAEFTLAFEGPVDADATRVSVGLNSRRDFLTVADTYPNTSRPTFTFADLPLPGVGLDDEAAGPGDTVGLDLEPRSTTVTGAEHLGPARIRVAVTQIEVTPTLVTVDIEAVHEGDVARNVTEVPPRLAVEVDGQSLSDQYPFELEWITTDDGTLDRLTLEPGDELRASFAFRGVVPPEATALRLGFQVTGVQLDRGGDADERPNSNLRAIIPGLPLPEGVGADDGSADGEG